MRRNRLISAFAGAFLLAASASGQENSLAAALDRAPMTTAPTNAACPNYAMPIIAPAPNKSAVLSFRPSAAIDFKLIVINPCAPQIAPPPAAPLAPDAEMTLDGTILTTPPAPLRERVPPSMK